MLAAIGMLTILAVTCMRRPAEGQIILGGMIRNDLFAYVFRIIFIAAGTLTLPALPSIFARCAPTASSTRIIILSTHGHVPDGRLERLIMLYLATETASFSLYLLAGFMRGNKLSAEAGVKYFVFGAVTSSIMLYGLSLFFGLSGGRPTTRLSADADRNPDLRMAATFALACWCWLALPSRRRPCRSISGRRMCIKARRRQCRASSARHPRRPALPS